MAAEDPGSGLASSLTDLMTSLAVIFILLLVALVNNKQRELQAAQRTAEQKSQELVELTRRTQETRSDVLDKLREALSDFLAQDMKVEADENDPLGVLVLVPERLLKFDFDESDVPEEGLKFLEGFVPRLRDVICNFQEKLSSVVVEGHTDSKGDDAYNLELSQRRSMEVVRQSLAILGVSKGAAPEQLARQSCFLDKLSASGRGERDLIYQDGVEAAASSRRVVFKIRVRSFEQLEHELRDFHLDQPNEPANAN